MIFLKYLKTTKKCFFFSSKVFNNFEGKRETRENESFICLLIRNDSVEEFISYVNKVNITFRFLKQIRSY